MAKARHHKRKKTTKRQRQQGFHETLSAAGNLPSVRPELSPAMQQGLASVANYGRTAATQLQLSIRHLVVRLQTIYHLQLQPHWNEIKAQTIVITGQLQPWTDRLRTTLAAAGSWSARYGQTAAGDIRAGARWTWRHTWSRRARALYLALIAGGILTGVLMAISTIGLYSDDISSPAALMNKKKTGTTIVDRNGQVLFEGYGAQNTKVIPLAEIPQQLKDATLAAEDPDFYSHPGFSWRATFRAAWVDVTHGGKVEGGSTLTQQLVKNAILTSHKTFERKYQEVLLSMELERRYSKDQILEMYLNEIYYGQGSHGVEAAAQTYFHKRTQYLTLGEAALLAGLPLGPSRFDPNVSRQVATDRRNFVLDRMASQGKVTPDQAAAAKAEPVVANAKTVTIKAPHFVFYVLGQLRKQYSEDTIENGGLTVHTTLDLGKQEAAQTIVQQQVERLSGHHATNGGLVSLEPGTGDIISMVGSVGYNAPGFGAVNITLSELQPGSSFKPIAYATAFAKGWDGSTQVEDKPMQVPQGDGSMYVPQNYDGKFRGKVTLRRSLANSLNIPALEVIKYAGINETIDMAHALGVTSLNERNRYGISLVLGGGEVRPLDMATVYATFANGGQRIPPRAILKVDDRNGHDVTKTPPPAAPKPALDPRYAYMITSILSDNAARTEEFGANSPLKLSRPAAAKTGTTNDFRDNWTVGYTPNLVTAVWVGNNDHSAMYNVDGITGAAPIWHDYMEMAHAGIEPKDFIAPAGLTSAKVCGHDGGLANPWDSGYTEVFPAERMLTRHCASQDMSAIQQMLNQFKEQQNKNKSNEPEPGPGGDTLPIEISTPAAMQGPRGSGKLPDPIFN